MGDHIATAGLQLCARRPCPSISARAASTRTLRSPGSAPAGTRLAPTSRDESACSATAVVPRPIFLRGSATPVLGTIVFISSETVFFGFITALHRLPPRVPRRSGNPRPRRRADGPLQRGAFRQQRDDGAGRSLAERDDLRGFKIMAVGNNSARRSSSSSARSPSFGKCTPRGFRSVTNLFTSVFYTLVGFHGLHVAIGSSRWRSGRAGLRRRHSRQPAHPG